MRIRFFARCPSTSLHRSYRWPFQPLLPSAHRPTCSPPASPQPPYPTKPVQTHPPLAGCRAVKWLGTGLVSGEDQSTGTRTSFSWQTQQVVCLDTQLSPLLSPASPVAGGPLVLARSGNRWRAAWLSSNDQTLVVWMLDTSWRPKKKKMGVRGGDVSLWDACFKRE